VCEEVVNLEAELDATNRQVEILSDALAESRREVAALKVVQEPVAWANPNDLKNFDMKVRTNGGPLHTLPLCLCTPPAAQRPDVDAMIALVRADEREETNRRANASWTLMCEKMVAAEREACAKLCYELPWKDMGHIPSNLAFAAAIRARGETK
jgi:hypothetical protein